MDTVRPHCDRLNSIAYMIQVAPVMQFKDKRKMDRRLQAMSKRRKSKSV